MSLILARNERSYVIERPSSTAGHRAPTGLTPEKLDGFFQSLRANGAELIWEEGKGFLLY